MAIKYAEVSAPAPQLSNLATVTEVNGRRTARLSHQTGAPTIETLDRKGNRVPIEKQPVKSNDLETRVIRTVTGELSRLVQLANTDPRTNPVANWDDFQEMMADPAFRPYREMFDKFAELKDFSDQGTRTWKLKSADLEEYLKGDGKIAAYELTLIKLQEMESAAASFLQENLPKAGADVIDGRHGNRVVTGDEGVLREMLLTDLPDWWQTPFTVYGKEAPIGPLETHGDAVVAGASLTALTTTVGAAAGTLLLPGLGTAAGAGIGAGVGAAASAAVAFIANGFSRGEDVTVQQSLDALRLSQQNPAIHRKWGRLMYGLDVANWTVNGNRVVVRPEIAANQQIASATLDPQSTRDMLHEIRGMVVQMQSEMGVRRDLAGGIDRPGQQTPQRGIVTEDQVTTILKQRLNYPDPMTGILIPCQIRNVATGEWEDNPAFNLTQVNADTVWMRRREVHRELVANLIAEDIARFEEGKKNRLAELLGTVTQKRADSGPGGARALARIKEVSGRESKLTEDEASLQAELDKFVELKDPLDKRRKALESIRQARARVTTTVALPVVVGTTTIADVDAALNFVLSDTTLPARAAVPAGPGGVPPAVPARPGPLFSLAIDGTSISGLAGQVLDISERCRIAIDNIRNAPVPARGDPTKANNAMIASLEHDRDLEIKRVRDTLVGLVKGVQSSIADAQKAINGDPENPNDAGIQGDLENKDSARRQIERTTTEMMTSRATIEGWGFTTAQLQNLSYDELERQINAMYNPLFPTVGWPARGNNNNNNDNPQNRERLLHAIAEARASASSTTIDNPGALFVAATFPSAGGMQESQLLVLSADALRTELTTRLGYAVTEAEITNLQTVVTTRSSVRQRAIDGVIEELNDRKKPLVYQRKQYEEKGIPSEEFDTLERLITRMPKINARITGMRRDELIAALDTRPANVVRPAFYTDAERIPVVGGPQLSNAEAWLRLEMFGSRDSDQAGVKFGGEIGPDAAYRKYHSQLAANNLRIAAIRRFDFLRVGIMPATFDDAIVRIRAEIQAGRLSNVQFARFVTQELIGYFADQRVQTL